jgi:hypothetical protein
LLDSTLHRPFVITVWRILHGQLGCNAFLHYVQRSVGGVISAPCSNLCRSPACSAAGRVETLTHAFLDCPESAAAADWLCAAWAALTGKGPPPRTATVLLADDVRDWTVDSPAGTPQAIALWNRLRVAVIGSIWEARCARDRGRLPQVSLSRHAIATAVQYLTEAIRRDWLRTTTDIRELDNGYFCMDWWRGMNPKMSFSDFCSTWAYQSIFCTADAGDEEANPPRAASIVIHLDQDLPVAFPL